MGTSIERLFCLRGAGVEEITFQFYEAIREIEIALDRILLPAIANHGNLKRRHATHTFKLANVPVIEFVMTADFPIVIFDMELSIETAKSQVPRAGEIVS